MSDVWTDLEIEAAAEDHAAKIAALPVADQPRAVCSWLKFMIDKGLKGAQLAEYQRRLTAETYRLRQERRDTLSRPRLP